MGLTLLFPDRTDFLLPVSVKTSFCQYVQCPQSLSGPRYADKKDASIARKVSSTGSAVGVLLCLKWHELQEARKGQGSGGSALCMVLGLRDDLAPNQFSDPP